MSSKVITARPLRTLSVKNVSQLQPPEYQKVQKGAFSHNCQGPGLKPSSPTSLFFVVLFVAMITHDTLYSLANTLGALAMCTVVVYHFIAVNAKYVTRGSVAA
jgi:Oligosaccaryltransferase